MTPGRNLTPGRNAMNKEITRLLGGSQALVQRFTYDAEYHAHVSQLASENIITYKIGREDVDG